MRNYNPIKLDSFNTWKTRFNEKLIDITDFQDLNILIKDKRVSTLLNTTLKELYKNNSSLGASYKYAFGEMPEILDMTLGEYLKSISIYERGFIKIYLSKNKEVEGFIFYTLDRADIKVGNTPRVQDVCVLSFDLDKNSLTLAKDTFDLVKELLSKYTSVHWTAFKENPACNFYKRTCLKLGGAWEENEDFDGVLDFYIPGKNKIDYKIEESKDYDFRVNNDLLNFNLVRYYYCRSSNNKDIRNLAEEFDKRR